MERGRENERERKGDIGGEKVVGRTVLLQTGGIMNELATPDSLLSVTCTKIFPPPISPITKYIFSPFFYLFAVLHA